jgi:hydrogenase maturation protease
MTRAAHDAHAKLLRHHPRWEKVIMPPRILVAGIGNIFLGDDMFGVEVVRRLATRRLPEGVRVVDFGTRGLDLVFALLEEDDAVILVDAAPRGEPAGTLYVLEPEDGASAEADIKPASLDLHSMDPVSVLRLVRALGGPAKRVLLVGCEPELHGADEDPPVGLSAPVEAAVDEAVGMIEALIDELRDPRPAPQVH